MRELSGGKPVGIKLCVGQPHEVLAVMKAMLKTEIHRRFHRRRRRAKAEPALRPLELSDWVGHAADRRARTRSATRSSATGLREQVRLAASGKVYSGMGLAHNLAHRCGLVQCGPSLHVLDRLHPGAALPSRHLPDRNHDPGSWRQRGLVVEVQAERCRAVSSQDAATPSPKSSPQPGWSIPPDLKPHHLIHRIGSTDARQANGSRFTTSCPKTACSTPPGRPAWPPCGRAADPDSFRPGIESGSAEPSRATANATRITQTEKARIRWTDTVAKSSSMS